MKTPTRFRRRGGSTALEFALVLPTLLLLLTGFFEFGWAFFQHDLLTRALRSGCRAGALIPADVDPSGAAEEAVRQYLDANNYSCGQGSCGLEVTTLGSSPDRMLACSITADFQPLTGAIPFMDELPLKTATRLRVEWVE